MSDIAPHSILFPYDEQENRYRYSFYEEGMTYNQVSKDEVNRFFSGLNKSSPVFEAFKSQPKEVNQLVISTIASFVIGCFLIFYGRYAASSTFMVILGALCIVGGFSLGFKTVNRFMDVQEGLLSQTKEEISKYVNKNSDGVKSKNLMWNVPEDHFEWIELKLAPNAKFKSCFSEKDTTVSDSTFRRGESTVMDFTPRYSKQQVLGNI